jgi:hypothetical protein
MSHTLYIRSGEWVGPDGELLAICHAGHGRHMNDPSACHLKDLGPPPLGFYDLGEAFWHPTCGKVSMRLTPHPGTNMHGRGGILVHGPNKTPDPTDDSKGCPIMPLGPRANLALHPDRLVEVVAERPASVPVDPVQVEALAELLRLEELEPTELGPA